MIELEVHPEIHIREARQESQNSTCYECHRSFRAKSEDQRCIGLCDTCFDAVRHVTEPTISVHIKARPKHPVVL